jgi:type VI protein secretion system component VasF
MENLPSPARAERNQRRKLAFIPVWPVVAAFALVVALILFAR